jgi:hypothetical protein
MFAMYAKASRAESIHRKPVHSLTSQCPGDLIVTTLAGRTQAHSTSRDTPWPRRSSHHRAKPICNHCPWHCKLARLSALQLKNKITKFLNLKLNS